MLEVTSLSNSIRYSVAGITGTVHLWPINIVAHVFLSHLTLTGYLQRFKCTMAKLQSPPIATNLPQFI